MKHLTVYVIAHFALPGGILLAAVNNLDVVDCKHHRLELSIITLVAFPHVILLAVRFENLQFFKCTHRHLELCTSLYQYSSHFKHHVVNAIAHFSLLDSALLTARLELFDFNAAYTAIQPSEFQGLSLARNDLHLHAL